jgi:glycerol 2-dehydrogenase (NADP+)
MTFQLIKLDDEDMRFLNDWHKQPNMHRSLTPYHSLQPVPNVYGWTYEQHHWHGMGAGGVIHAQSAQL